MIRSQQLKIASLLLQSGNTIHKSSAALAVASRASCATTLLEQKQHVPVLGISLFSVRRFSFTHEYDDVNNNNNEEQDLSPKQQQQQQGYPSSSLFSASSGISSSHQNREASSMSSSLNDVSIGRFSLPDHAHTIQHLILESKFAYAKALLTRIQYYLEFEWTDNDSSEDNMTNDNTHHYQHSKLMMMMTKTTDNSYNVENSQRDWLEWSVYTARQLAGVCHEMGDDQEALEQCNKVFELERQCKKMNMLEDVFCELNFVSAVKAEILATRGEMDKALKWQNFLVENRLRKKLRSLNFHHYDPQFRKLLRRTMGLELATRGKILMAMGRMDDALKDFSESLQFESQHDRDGQTLLLRSKVYFMKQEYRLALLDAQKCLFDSSMNQYTQNQARLVMDECLNAMRNYQSLHCEE